MLLDHRFWPLLSVEGLFEKMTWVVVGQNRSRMSQKYLFTSVYKDAYQDSKGQIKGLSPNFRKIP
jgi:hypothetical protein